MCAWSGGNFTRVYGATGWATDAAGGVGIESGRHDVQDNDLATGIDSCLNKSGQNSMAADLNLGGYRPTNVAAGTFAAPAFCAGNDVNTGMYSPGADRIGFATNGVQRVEVSSDGNCGIGTTSTTGTRLTVIGEDNSNTKYSFGSYGLVGTAASSFLVRNDGRVGVGTSSLSAKVVIAAESITLPVLRLLGGGAGDVANRAFEIFKTDNDSTTSQNFVYFYINNGSTASGKINANGANAAAFGSTSDIRLKENVVNLPSQLDAILSLRPVEFDYKDGSGHQIGFIAQEVQSVFPDLIGEADGYLTLTDLNKNDARLIKAFQELAAKVEALEAKVQALEAVTEV